MNDDELALRITKHWIEDLPNIELKYDRLFGIFCFINGSNHRIFGARISLECAKEIEKIAKAVKRPPKPKRRS